MSLQAYKTAAQRAESPRELEYRLFGEVTRALIAASELPPGDFAARMPPLDLNRRMWGALASDCAHEGNALPPQLRANIISLALWVGRHTSAVMRREEEFGPLIEVNRTLMQGLAPASPSAPAQAA